MSVFHIPSCYLSLVVIVNTKRGEIYFFKFIRIGGQSIRKKNMEDQIEKKWCQEEFFSQRNANYTSTEKTNE